MVNIEGLDKAKVLVALFNNSHQQGLGFLDGRGQQNLSYEIAKEIVEQTTSFDYLFGRVLKVDISGDTFNEWLYDRDNGQGAAQNAIDSIRERSK